MKLLKSNENRINNEMSKTPHILSPIIYSMHIAVDLKYLEMKQMPLSIMGSALSATFRDMSIQ